VDRFDIEKVKGYTIMPNYHQRDRTLSIKAKGILSQMFSLPEGWDYTLRRLAYLNTDGIDSMRSGMRELERADYAFAFFAAALLLVYYLVPGRPQWCVLLAASYVFYLWAGTEYLAFILFTTLTTYFSARIIQAQLEKQTQYLSKAKASLSKEDKKAYKASLKKKNRLIMALCLAVNFIILAFCKECLTEPLRTAIQESRLSFLTLALPMGISFYMFQSMGYVKKFFANIDTYGVNSMDLVPPLSYQITA